MLPGNLVEVNYDKENDKIVTRIVAEVSEPETVETESESKEK